MNISESDIVSQFLLKNYPIEREQLQRIIGLETLLKTLSCWDKTIYPSPDITFSESMFLDSVISRVFTAYIKGTSFDLTQSELESSDFEEKGTGNQPFFPTALQV
jgi:hypothetical protein